MQSQQPKEQQPQQPGVDAERDNPLRKPGNPEQPDQSRQHEQTPGQTRRQQDGDRPGQTQQD